MKRLPLNLLSTLFLLSSFALQTAVAAETSRPNILFIGFDDMRPLMGCYGDPVAKTPNLDAFAKRSVLFSNAHVQQAVCAASRASFLTGCRPETTGVDYPYTKEFETTFIKDHPTITTRFHDEGYFTRVIGKIHHGSLDEPLSAPIYKRFTLHGHILPENKKLRQGQRQPFEHPEVADNAYADGLLADETIKTIRQQKKNEDPFFLAVGFFKPHLPWNCPKKYYDLYQTSEMPLAKVRELPVDGFPWSTYHVAVNAYAGPDPSNENILKDKRSRQLIHSYYACMSYVDAQFGRIIDELDRQGVMDDTIIVVWSDHGYHLGEQAMWGKSANFFLDTHVPLLVYTPTLKTAGETSPALVEYVDLYPTLTELAGLGTPDYLEGTSLTPLLEAPDREWKSAVFAQYPRHDREGFVVQTKDYRYIEWRERSEGGPIGEILGRELYDHRTDRYEARNLAGEADFQAVVSQMSQQLADGWKSALPPVSGKE
ncbi:MAG: sulfatase [Verrucomicrobiales bacterium]|nr:sulfatase [Verrucomicrobiales bacterium]